MRLENLYKLGGRRPADQGDGWTIYSRYILCDADEQELSTCLEIFKAKDGSQPEQFVEFVNSYMVHDARLLPNPVVSHELEHTDDDFRNTSMTEGEQ